MKTYETDVLVIGSELAGLRAAIEVVRQKANVIVVSKTVIGAGNTALAAGFFTIATPDFSSAQHMEAALRIGKNLDDTRLVGELAGHEIQRVEAIMLCH